MIDWERIEDLRSEIGAEDFMEVVELFLDEADEVVATFTDLSDFGEVEGKLHFLKGSALNLGLTDLAGFCQEGERRAAGGDPASVDLAKVASVYLASKRMMSDGLSRLAAA